MPSKTKCGWHLCRHNSTEEGINIDDPSLVKQEFPNVAKLASTLENIEKLDNETARYYCCTRHLVFDNLLLLAKVPYATPVVKEMATLTLAQAVIDLEMRDQTENIKKMIEFRKRF